VSGGMDGRVWVWPAPSRGGGAAAAAVPREVRGAHAAPVSKVAATPWSDAQVATASYDKSFKLWDVSRRGGGDGAVLLASSTTAHAAPVLELAAAPDGRIATGLHISFVPPSSRACCQQQRNPAVSKDRQSSTWWLPILSHVCEHCLRDDLVTT
jgi:hypothetical protein